MNNLTDKEKIFLLTYELQHAVSTVQFLHDCLVNPEHVKYGYPYMTLNELEFWKTILPKEQYCLQHAGLSVMKKGCKDCEKQQNRYLEYKRIKAKL